MHYRLSVHTLHIAVAADGGPAYQCPMQLNVILGLAWVAAKKILLSRKLSTFEWLQCPASQHSDSEHGPLEFHEEGLEKGVL